MSIEKIIRILPLLIVLSTFHMILVSCMSGMVKSAPGTTTTIVLIRHAEKTEQGDLSPEGLERSQALVDQVKDMGITAIYSPNIRRNIETVKPLSEKIGVPITLNNSVFTTLAVDDISEEILSKHAGGVVLYVGNVSGNLIAMHRHLGGSGMGPKEYGEMAIFSISDQGTIRVTESRFGK